MKNKILLLLLPLTCATNSMASLLFTTSVKQLIKHHRGFITCRSFLSSEAAAQEQVQNAHNESTEESPKNVPTKRSIAQLSEYRFVYPEFLPNAKYEYRHKIREKLERMDMLKRRSVIDIPEFYVGSILAVTAADPYAVGKENTFVGICISRTYHGLRATFTLRNVIEKQGIEILYDMYNPTIHKIEVLKLEKRLDDELYYLRDALPEYSTFPFDMEPEYIIEGQSVPVNPLKVKLRPPPWYAKWERLDLKGIEPLEDIPGVPQRRFDMARKHATPWEKFDLMKEYRRSIVEEDQKEIWEDVEDYSKQFQRKKQQWKRRILQKAPPKAKR